jgi:hypothetical protein
LVETLKEVTEDDQVIRAYEIKRRNILRAEKSKKSRHTTNKKQSF